MKRKRNLAACLIVSTVLSLVLMQGLAIADDSGSNPEVGSETTEQEFISEESAEESTDSGALAEDEEIPLIPQEEEAVDSVAPEDTQSDEEAEDFTEQASDGYYAIETIVSGSGTGSVSIAESAYSGNEIGFYVTPDSGSETVEVSVVTADGESVSVNSYVEDAEYYFYMPADNVTVYVVFEVIPHFTVTTEKTGTGSGTIEVTSETLEPARGDRVTYNVTPGTHSRIKTISIVRPDGTTDTVYKIGFGWHDGEDHGWVEEYGYYYDEFEMPNSDVVIRVEFEPTPRVDKNVTGSQYGKVTIVSGTMYPDSGHDVYFTAKPAADCRLAKLSVKTVDGETYTVNNGISKDEYYDWISLGNGEYKYESAYYFEMPDCVVTINATFEPIPRYAISKNYVGGSNGTVTIIGDGATLYPHAGDLVRFRTSPKTGYTLTRMSYTTESGKTKALTRVEGSGKAGTNSVYEFKMPAENVTLNATFAENHRYIDKVINGSGQLMLVDNGSGKATMYPKPGDKVRFKAIPASGFRLTNCNYTLSETGKTLALTKVSGTTNIYEFTMPNEDVTLGGRFIPVKAVWRSDGRYVVGKDIPAGVYVFMGTVKYNTIDSYSNGTWTSKPDYDHPYVTGDFECLKRKDGGWTTFRSGSLFLSDSNVSSRDYAEVKDGEVIQITEGAKFAFADYATPLNTKMLTKDGWYRVGIDCPAGLYRLTENDNSSASARYEVEPWVGSENYDKDGNYRYDLRKYATVLTTQNVRVESGEYLYITGCTAKWLKD